MSSKINIAFCFDENMMNPACVAIASLLDFKEPEDHYNIFCICSEKAFEQQGKIIDFVKNRDLESAVAFFRAPKQFDQAYEVRDITVSTYLRLMLHRVLENIDKIIYADVDVLFQGSLKKMWETDLEGTLLAGVKGANNFQDVWVNYEKYGYAEELEGLLGRYINAGILVMNLKAIREWNPDETWIMMSQRGYHYQDQDILNITCKGQVRFLDICYNVQAHLEKKDFEKISEVGLYSKEMCDFAWKYPAIIHYTGPKPWNNRGVHRGNVWWKYVVSQEDLKVLFDKGKIPNRKTTGLIGKINRHLPF